MMETKEISMHSDMKNATLRVLHYYTLFHYPLKLQEIHGCHSEKCSLPTVSKTLDGLLQSGKIYEYGGYYSIHSNIQSLVLRREQGNLLAMAKSIEANRAAHIIYSFPFVRFVGISGSLSKGYAEAASDFDFFIITAANRLWICRTMLHLFKKLTFLTGNQHHFCMNYFIDTEKLELEEKNRYTATELASLVPVYGAATYHDFVKANIWINDYLPNGYIRFQKTDAVTDFKSRIRTFVEKIIDHAEAVRINRLLMKITDKKWNTKWRKKNYPAADYNLAFKTTEHISKNHPANYQKKMLEHLAQPNDINY
jgi:hypothetical protein